MEPDKAEILYEWTALEFGRTKRGSRWYLAVAAAALLLGAYAVYTRDWLRWAALAMVRVVVGLVLRAGPREFRHALTPAGVWVGKKLYAYGDFSSFAIVESPDGGSLTLVPKRRLGLVISLQLGGADVERIRAVLSEYLEESDGSEDLLDRMNRAIGF